MAIAKINNHGERYEMTEFFFMRDGFELFTWNQTSINTYCLAKDRIQRDHLLSLLEKILFSRRIQSVCDCDYGRGKTTNQEI